AGSQRRAGWRPREVARDPGAHVGVEEDGRHVPVLRGEPDGLHARQQRVRLHRRLRLRLPQGRRLRGAVEGHRGAADLRPGAHAAGHEGSGAPQDAGRAEAGHDGLLGARPLDQADPERGAERLLQVLPPGAPGAPPGQLRQLRPLYVRRSFFDVRGRVPPGDAAAHLQQRVRGRRGQCGEGGRRGRQRPGRRHELGKRDPRRHQHLRERRTGEAAGRRQPRRRRRRRQCRGALGRGQRLLDGRRGGR
ncbi:unnamed protein product, partial [Prorocentrum cordatum]